MNTSKNKAIPTVTEMPKFRMASVPKCFDNIRVIEGSDELIFQETYVTVMLANDRVAKFKKNTLVFA